jgi:hypothetical protein
MCVCVCVCMCIGVLISKACRGAIMFGDTLSREQCQKLLFSLRQCALPFQCAHGRPTLVPLVRLAAAAHAPHTSAPPATHASAKRCASIAGTGEPGCVNLNSTHTHTHTHTHTQNMHRPRQTERETEREAGSFNLKSNTPGDRQTDTQTETEREAGGLNLKSILSNMPRPRLPKPDWARWRSARCPLLLKP